MSARSRLTLASELALTGLTVVVAISLERLFTDTSFLRELLIMVIGSHVVAIVCRRADLSMAWATPISGLAMVVLGTAVFYPDAAALILPTREVVDLLGDDLREAWQVFSDDSAPVPPLKGFVVTTAVLMWYGAFLGDWAAFRLRSPLEAVAPAVAVFVFGSLLGIDRHAVAHGTLLAIGLFAVLATMRAERQVREEVWVASRADEGVRTTLGVGAVLGALAIAVGVIVAPRLPGADAQPLIDVTEINQGPETRAVVSPLVEVQTNLVQQSDQVMFTVEAPSDEGQYWRLMALTTYEDDIWRRSSNFSAARGPVPSDLASDVERRILDQRITIQALGNIYLPAAFEIDTIADSGAVDLEYETATGALVVARGLDQVPRGYTYEIQSALPVLDADVLRSVDNASVDGGFLNEHTQLPRECESGETSADGCWPVSVTDFARELTAGLTNDYDRARTIQDFFQVTGGFEYDINQVLAHDVEDIEQFLFTIRAGYCEQFSATFAAMARSIGIPARVAVGFTKGQWDPSRGAWVVRGEHAHAWPEVYFEGIGWQRFEPTPSRGSAHDFAVTGVPEAQAGDDPDATTETIPPPTVTQGPSGPSNVDPGPGDLDEVEEATPVIETGDDSSLGRILVFALAGLGTAVALVGFVPAVQLVRRRRRLSRVAADPVGRGELAWDDAVAALRLVNIFPGPHQTPLEFATEITSARRALGPVRELAAAVTTLRYAAGIDAVAQALAAQDAAAEITHKCRGLAGSRRVLADAVDPRTLRQPAPQPLIGR